MAGVVYCVFFLFFFFQAEDGIRDHCVTGVQTCALPIFPKSAAKEDDLMGIILEAGAEDLRDDGDNWEVLCEPSAYEAVLEAVKKAGIEPSSSSVAMIPQNYIKLEGPAASTMIRLMEALEDHDDVQNVHSNFDIDQKLLEEVAG